MAVCVGCGKPVIWCKNDKTGKSAPVNPEPDPTGNVWMVGDGEYHVMNKTERTVADVPVLFDGPPQARRFTLHFATCTKADGFRKRDPKAHKQVKR